MKNFKSPFDTELQKCQEKINEYEECLQKEKELRSSLLTNIAAFYTNELGNSYYKIEKGGKLGQIDKVFSKNGKFFVRVYFLDVTVNSKIRKVYSNLELFGIETESMKILTEAEYKSEFFDYINRYLKCAEAE